MNTSPDETMVDGAERDHRNQQQLEPRGVLVRPLGAFERMYYRFSQKSTTHFCVVAELADDLDPAVLNAALSVVQQHHPLLNVYVEDHPQTGPVGRLRRFVQTPGAVNAAAQSDLRTVATAITLSPIRPPPRPGSRWAPMRTTTSTKN